MGVVVSLACSASIVFFITPLSPSYLKRGKGRWGQAPPRIVSAGFASLAMTRVGVLM